MTPITFEEETEPIRVDTLGGPGFDPSWKFVDAAGHKHRYYKGPKDASPFPTLRWVVDRTYFCEDCRDEHEDGHWECFACGETIEPKTIYKPPRTEFLPGPRTRKINGVVVDDETWDEALAIQKRSTAEAEERIAALVEEKGYR